MGAFIALFFALQSYGVAHASSYGDAPHEHDGVACSVTVMSDDQAVILPASPIIEPIASQTIIAVYPNFTSAPYTTPQGRAPPPRAPPNSI